MSPAPERMRRFATRWFSGRTSDRVIASLLADFETEDREAAARGSRLRRWWLGAAYAFAFAKVCCLCIGSQLVLFTPALSPEDWRALRRAALVTFAASTFVTVVLSIPPLMQQNERFIGQNATHPGLNAPLVLVALLIPQGVAIGLPIGLLVGIIAGVSGRLATRRIATIILAVAMLCSIVAFVNLGWVVPAANQSFRTELTGRVLVRGASELTLSELRALLTPGGHIPMAVEWPHDMALLAWSYHVRLALAWAPFGFALCALATIVRSRRLVTKILIPATAFGFYYVGLYSSRPWVFNHVVSAAVAVWSPSVVVGLISIAALVTSTQHPPVQHSKALD